MGSQQEKSANTPPEQGSALTTCPFCSCGCGLYLQHDSTHTTGSSPSLTHPVAQGHLCARGWAAHEMSAWGPRLLTPLVRRNGSLREASWDEALDRAHEELRGLLDEHRSVGVLVSGRSPTEECYLATRLARGALRTGNLDDCLRSSYAGLLNGLVPSAGHWLPPGSLVEIEKSSGILLLEGDLAESHPRVAFAVLKALRRGARLITVGLAETQMSRLARRHLFLDPGELTAFVEPLREAMADSPVVGTGGLSVILTSFTGNPGALATVTRALAEVAFQAGKGPGSRVRFLPLPPRANSRGAFDMGVAPDHLPGSRRMEDDGARTRIQDAWGRSPSWDPGLSAERMMGRVEGLVVVRDHPPASLLFPDQAMRALKGLKSLVVLDAYRSPTSETATVCLPIPTLAESRGFLTSMGGRVQRFRPACPSPGQARPGWQVLSHLLYRWDPGCSYESPEAVFQEIRSVVPEYECLSSDDLDQSGGRKISLFLARPEALGPASGSSGLPEAAPEGAEGEEGDGKERESWETSVEGRGPAASWLALDGSFDWHDDPLVLASPTLRRDGTLRRKRFPQGLVTMNPEKAKRLGIRAGWTVRLRSRHGEVTTTVLLSRRVPENLILAPFGVRNALAPVLGDSWAQRVEVESA